MTNRPVPLAKPGWWHETPLFVRQKRYKSDELLWLKEVFVVKLVSFGLLLAAVAALAQPPPIAAGNLEAAVRHADEAWAKAIASKSVEQTVIMYDADAFTSGSAMPPARGLTEIRALWTEVFAHSGFSLTGKAEQVVVTEPGTIATSTGRWRMTAPDCGAQTRDFIPLKPC